MVIRPLNYRTIVMITDECTSCVRKAVTCDSDSYTSRTFETSAKGFSELEILLRQLKLAGLYSISKPIFDSSPFLRTKVATLSLAGYNYPPKMS